MRLTTVAIIRFETQPPEHPQGCMYKLIFPTKPIARAFFTSRWQQHRSWTQLDKDIFMSDIQSSARQLWANIDTIKLPPRTVHTVYGMQRSAASQREVLGQDWDARANSALFRMIADTIDQHDTQSHLNKWWPVAHKKGDNER